MTRIPRKAWPALAIFDPERFRSLQLRCLSLEPESTDMRSARAELETLIRDFKEWAVAVLAHQRQVHLLAVCGREQVEQRVKEKYWEKRFADLAKADLTLTEYERLMRLVFKHTDSDRAVKAVEDALQVLEKPWKHRDVIDRRQHRES